MTISRSIHVAATVKTPLNSYTMSTGPPYISTDPSSVMLNYIVITWGHILTDDSLTR